MVWTMTFHEYTNIRALHLPFFIWNFRSKLAVSALPLEQEDFRGEKSNSGEDMNLDRKKLCLYYV